jgi:hypothetical protein
MWFRRPGDALITGEDAGAPAVMLNAVKHPLLVTLFQTSEDACPTCGAIHCASNFHGDESP